MTTPAGTAPLRFGRFELQPRERRLLVDGQPAALGGRAFDLLLALAERPGQLVSKRVLIDLVWPEVVVEENNLPAQVSALRRVLGDDAIATIPGRGYRFAAHIESPATATSPNGSSAPAPRGIGSDTPIAETPRTNLPGALPALVGRAEDLFELSALVDVQRLVTIVGPGGIGKSLLAQHLLHARRGDYPQGVCWVELTPLDATALASAVAASLGVYLGGGEPLASLIGAVAPLKMLLALDNAEHMLGDVAHLCQALHDGAPDLRIVVTSQAPLRLSAERVFRIGPLAVPPAIVPAAQAQQFGAVALFVDRAQAMDRQFALTDRNAGPVIELCRALDGLPLAIELAAARAPMLGVQRLLASMQDRLQVLTTNRNRTAPARQRTLRATLEWSHGFLEPHEQQVFRRLGVIAGSGSLDFIAEVVADGDDRSERARWVVLDALDTLVDRSLVAVLAAEDDGAPRYRLLESLRAYALERPDASGERPALQRRHALALAKLFDAAYHEYFRPGVGADDWMRRLAADLDNARDAVTWARAAGETGVEITIAATLLRALPQSLYAERLALADECAARLTASLPEPLRLRAWIELSCVWGNTQKVRSYEAAERALVLARKLDDAHGDRFVLYHALCRSAGTSAKVGRVEVARAHLEELQALEDPGWPAQRLLWGAEAAQFVAHARGDGAEALRHSRRMLDLERQRGKDASIALGNLVDAELAAGNALAASRSGSALVAALEGTRHEFTLALARLNLCAAWLALDDPMRARDVAQALWPQAVFFDYPHYAACYLALLAALEARPRAAARLLGYCEAVYLARHGETLAPNEAAAVDRARALASAAIGLADFQRLRTEGAKLATVDISSLAFGIEDA